MSLKVSELSGTVQNKFFCEVTAMQAYTDGSEEHTDSLFRDSALDSTCSSDSG
jgi:hypothetical protein